MANFVILAMMKPCWIAGFLLLLVGCNRNDPAYIHLVDLNGFRIDASFVASNKVTTFVFLEPDCPLSQNYTLTLQQLHDRFAPQGMVVCGVFPGVVERAAVDSFIVKYRISFPIYYDPGLELTKAFSATVTPEAIVVNPVFKVMYRGAIDNWAIDLGKKRSKATAYYLKDALQAIVEGLDIDPVETKPVGCYIERLP